MKPGEYGIVLGNELARGARRPHGRARRHRHVAADHDAGGRDATHAHVQGRRTVLGRRMYEYDRNLAYVHDRRCSALYRMGDDVTGLRLKLADMFAAPRVVRELAVALGGGITSTTGAASMRPSSVRSS